MGTAVNGVASWASDNGWALLAITVIVVLGQMVSEAFRYHTQKAQTLFMNQHLALLESSRKDMSEIAKAVISTLCSLVTR